MATTHLESSLGSILIYIQRLTLLWAVYSEITATKSTIFKLHSSDTYNYLLTRETSRYLQMNTNHVGHFELLAGCQQQASVIPKTNYVWDGLDSGESISN